MQRSPLVSLVLILFLGTWLFQEGSAQGAAPASEGAQLEARTLILVRHGEKGADDPRDPSLSEEGHARAEELARVLEHAQVTHLFSTAYKRTRQTLAPLGSALELEVATYNPRDMGALMGEVKNTAPGSVIVIAGHSNTTPGLYRMLTGEDPVDLEQHPRYGALLPEEDYDRLFVISLIEQEGQLECVSKLEMRYGDQ